MVVNQIKMDNEDELDVLFWLNKSSTERIFEVTRLRRKYFTWLNRVFSTKIEKAVHKRKI